MPIFNYYINNVNDLLSSVLPLQDCSCCPRLLPGIFSHRRRGTTIAGAPAGDNPVQ